MPRITLDAAAIAQFANLLSPVEVCDTEGKVIGVYRPKLDPARYGPLEPQVSEEELARREKSTGPWWTTEEVLERAKRRAQEGR